MTGKVIMGIVGAGLLTTIIVVPIVVSSNDNKKGKAQAGTNDNQAKNGSELDVFLSKY